MSKLFNSEKAQGLVEYALILVLVSIVVLAALMVLGPKIPAIIAFLSPIAEWDWGMIMLTGGATIAVSTILFVSIGNILGYKRNGDITSQDTSITGSEDEKAQGLVEYALLLVLVAIVAIAIFLNPIVWLVFGLILGLCLLAGLGYLLYSFVSRLLQSKEDKTNHQ